MAMTHKEIADPIHRKVLANELLVLRRLRKESKIDINDDYFSGVRIGFETALRRLEFIRVYPLEKGWER